MTVAKEWNFDGLVGPTHNYAGLSLGNVASFKNAQLKAYPKEAALQGLQKMKALADLGFQQGVLAPQQRPDLAMLRRLGFSGSDSKVLERAAVDAPQVLAACFSASSMWTANAATVSPSADTSDGKLHLTPANLVNKFHRALEPEVTGRILKAIFSNPKFFHVHEPLPQLPQFGDEGAANHTRLCSDYGAPGVEFFVYGFHAFDTSKPIPKKYPARQSLEASEAIARRHLLAANQVVFAQQNPDVIDQGVFHNDVISVGNKNLLFTHQHAFVNQKRVLEELKTKVGEEFQVIEVDEKDVSVLDAVESYLFNSQLLSSNDKTLLVCPEECRNNDRVHAYLSSLSRSSTPIDEVLYMDVKQSMQNGGGPACLRLRIVLTEEEERAINPRAILTEELYQELLLWVNRHYRDEISPADFCDTRLVTESLTALDELTQIMNLGPVYPFQR